MVMVLELELGLGLGSRLGQRLSQGGAGAGVASMGSTEALTDGAGHEVHSGGLYLDIKPVAVGHQQPWGRHTEEARLGPQSLGVGAPWEQAGT